MKTKLLFSLSVLLVVLWCPNARAQSLVIRTNDGSESKLNVQSLKVIKFSDGNLVVNNSSGTTEAFSLGTISKIYFDAVATGIESTTANLTNKKLVIYPNPVSDKLYFNDAPDESFRIEIFQPNGILMFESKLSAGTRMIDIGFLSRGIYILKINNQSGKFVKL